MKSLKKVVPIAFLAVGLSVGAVVGVGVFNKEPVDDAVAVDEVSPEYGVNENGMTYGSASFAMSDDELPDLVSAVGDNGKVGYILKEDFTGEQPANPEEAVAYMERMKEREAQGIYGKEVPLYDTDGVTVIGTFTIGSQRDDVEVEHYAVDASGNRVSLD